MSNAVFFCCLQYEGSLNDDFVPYVVDLINKPNLLIPYFDTQLTERFINPEQRELLYVPGSNQGVMNIYGKVLIVTYNIVR